MFSRGIWGKVVPHAAAGPESPGDGGGRAGAPAEAGRHEGVHARCAPMRDLMGPRQKCCGGWITRGGGSAVGGTPVQGSASQLGLFALWPCTGRAPSTRQIVDVLGVFGG
jgi:hypothetical protein